MYSTNIHRADAGNGVDWNVYAMYFTSFAFAVISYQWAVQHLCISCTKAQTKFQSELILFNPATQTQRTVQVSVRRSLTFHLLVWADGCVNVAQHFKSYSIRSWMPVAIYECVQPIRDKAQSEQTF